MKQRIRWENKNFDDTGTFTCKADLVSFLNTGIVIYLFIVVSSTL